MSTHYIRCPQCDKIIFRSTCGFETEIGNPIKICPLCNREYIHPYVYEWSVISPLFKLYFCLGASERFLGFLIAFVIGLLTSSWLWFFIILTLFLIYCLFRMKLCEAENIKESYKRTKNNPEYIQKLSDLGYMKLDPRIDPFYK